MQYLISILRIDKICILYTVCTVYMYIYSTMATVCTKYVLKKYYFENSQNY